MNDEIIQLATGAFLVALYSFRRYNTPESNRYATTITRFNLVYLCYLTITLTVFLGLYLCVDNLNKLDPSLSKLIPGFPSISAALEGIPPAIGATLILTTMLPSIPWLSKFDKRILERMWDLGKIPAYMIVRIEKLKRSHITTTSPYQKEQLLKLADEWEYRREYLVFEPDSSVNYQWVKVSLLLLEIRKRNNSKYPRYNRYIEMHKSEYERLFFDMQSLTKKMSSYFQLMAEDLPGNTRSRKMQRNLFSTIEDRLDQIEKWVIEFLVLMINSSELSEKKRVEVTRQIGFDDGGESIKDITFFQILQLMVLIFGGYFGLSMLDNLVRDQSLLSTSTLFQTLIMATTYNIAVFAAIYMNRNFRKRFIVSDSFAFVTRFSAGVLSALGWVISVFALRTLQASINDSVTDIAGAMARTYPYAIQNFILGFSLAWLLELAHKPEPLTEAVRLSKFRVTCCLKLGAIMTLLSLPIVFMLYHAKDPGFRQSYIESLSWLMEIIKAGSIGLLIGYFIPYWYQLNKLNSPMQSLFSFLRYYHDNICKETRQLERGQLETILVKNALVVAQCDDHLHPLELKIIRQLIFHLDSSLDDFSGNIAEDILNKVMGTEDNVAEYEAPESSLKSLHYLPHLRQVIIYSLESVAWADGVVEHEEREVLHDICSGSMRHA
ncbi:TerB family tellurite resistance protein [Alkalimarinus coralli]|uniref:TerB family tellurite resistance protein n=1 Tax=Alkalimarinus coralli TaxID=2935863 RepID=UPI00202B99C2|nr:TerB family tellurite resistance protein [Alkalimarinus coralli]